MNDKIKILLMYSGVIDMKADDGDTINGVSVEYFFYGDHGEMVEPKTSADGISGIRRGKSFMDPDTARKISFVPGIYDGQFEMTVGSNGKPTLKLVDVDFVAKASITAVEDKAVNNGK